MIVRKELEDRSAYFTKGLDSTTQDNAALLKIVFDNGDVDFVVVNRDWNEEDHPRDEDGKFTFSGGGPSTSDEGAYGGLVMPPEVQLHPDVINVSGDEWNKQTAVRLEREYQVVKSDLGKLASAAAGQSAEAVSSSEDDSEDFVAGSPDEWDNMSGSQQEDAKQHYIDSNKSSAIDNEVQSWHDNGDALDDAKSSVAHDFDKGDDTDWASEALAKWREDWQADSPDDPIPFTDQQILDSLSIQYQNGYSGNGKLTVDFNDAALTHPDETFNPAFTADQLPLPGVDAPAAKAPHEALTDLMRTTIINAISDTFNDHAETVESNMDAPEYLTDSALEYLDQSWDDKDDSDKFDYAEQNTLPKDDTSSDSSAVSDGVIDLPKRFDPLDDHGGADYKNTQRLATRLSLDRQVQLMKERGLGQGVGGEGVSRSQIKRIDDELWAGWKGSSTNFAGSVVQLAAARELGGRYRELPTHSADLIKQADDKYSHIGGFEGVKAMVRAKWETTQYLLDKAGVQRLELYRGLKMNLASADKDKIETITTNNQFGDSTKYERVPNVEVVRNGALSTTTDRSVANSWSAGTGNTKLVLRIDTPRTSVLSVPAYGINVHSEHEVVVAGTAWGKWDAWENRAPGFNEVPMKAAA